MAYTRKKIKNLTGGVSEQPDSERFDNQCSEQVNFLPDLTRGLTKRDGTNYVQIVADNGTPAALTNDSVNTFTHLIDRSADEQLMLVVGYNGSALDNNPDISLLKLNEEGDAAEILTVQDKDGNDLSDVSYIPEYLKVANKAYDTHPYSAATIADYTFIANKDVTPALKADTSGGAGMYEREHVKRGLIFVRESAYSSEFVVKATDSEGTIRSAKIFTGSGTTGDSPKDIRTSNIAAAIHGVLEIQEESASGSPFDEGVTVGSTTNAWDSYLSGNTGISIDFEDDSTDHLFNGGGGTTALSGSNYSSGYFTFLEQPSDGDTMTLDGGVPFHVFDFYDNGTTYGGGNVGVEIGLTLNETAENLATALNNVTDIKFTASLTLFDEDNPSLRIVSTIEEDISAAGGGTIAATGFSYSSSNVSGGNASAASSTAPVRHQITFERLEVEDGGSTKTTGSVIAWRASYPSKAAAEASPIKIEVTDSYGDTMVETFTEVTDKISTLPTLAPNNYLLKVEGDSETDADDHYIKFESDSTVALNNEIGKGKWGESLASGIQHKIDESTMPHQLIKVDSTTYKFVPATWKDKTVGDENSDVKPSFIGNPINDIFYYKSRLGVLAGESVVLSEVDDAYNFWRTSVIASVDSDRIDVTSAVNEITYLNWAVPFANQLVVFADRTQFLLAQGTQGLTPSTASLTRASGYENSTIARPVVNDNSIIFAQEKSGSSAVYEMIPTGATEVAFEATNISEHIPTYIGGKITKLMASSLASVVIAQTDSGDNKLYIYRYFNSNGKRVQSAWSRYELACNYIKCGGFIKDKFHILEGHNQTAGGAEVLAYQILTYMKFDNTDSITNAVDLHWDVPVSAITDAGGGESDITFDGNFPIRQDTTRQAKIVVFDKTTNETHDAAPSQPAQTWKIRVKDDIVGEESIVVGLKFTASYEFSKQYLKRQTRDGREAAITDGRTTTKWVEVYFNDSQHLDLDVTFPAYALRTDSSKTFTGNPDNTISGVRAGEQPSETERIRTSVAARNDLPTITLSSDTHQTVTITGASFEMMHTSRLSRTN